MKKKPPTPEEFSKEVEAFFLRVCQASGARSAQVGITSTLEAVALAFRRMVEVLTPSDTDIDPAYWQGSADYWREAAELVDGIKEQVR